MRAHPKLITTRRSSVSLVWVPSIPVMDDLELNLGNNGAGENCGDEVMKYGGPAALGGKHSSRCCSVVRAYWNGIAISLFPSLSPRSNNSLPPPSHHFFCPLSSPINSLNHNTHTTTTIQVQHLVQWKHVLSTRSLAPLLRWYCMHWSSWWPALFLSVSSTESWLHSYGRINLLPLV